MPVSPNRHNFTDLQRLAAALKDFNQPEKGPDRITVWRRAGSTGVSLAIGFETIDLTTAIYGWADKCKGLDLANVAVLSKGVRAIRFFDMRKFVESGKPSGVKLTRGDLVVVLRPMAK